MGQFQLYNDTEAIRLEVLLMSDSCEQRKIFISLTVVQNE